MGIILCEDGEERCFDLEEIKSNEPEPLPEWEQDYMFI